MKSKKKQRREISGKKLMRLLRVVDSDLELANQRCVMLSGVLQCLRDIRWRLYDT